MGRTGWMVVAWLAACGKGPPAEPAASPPVVADPAPPPSPADAAPPPPPDAAPPPRPAIRVASGASVDAGGLALELREGNALQLRVGGQRIRNVEPGEVAWIRGRRVEIVGAGADFVALHVDRVTKDVVAGSELTVRAKRKKAVDIGGGVSLRLLGHGHKRVAAGGPKSPLMVAVQYREGDVVIGSQDFNLYPPDESTWTWRDYAFRMTDYEYGAFMVVKVHRRALAPVPAQ